MATSRSRPDWPPTFPAAGPCQPRHWGGTFPIIFIVLAAEGGFRFGRASDQSPRLISFRIPFIRPWNRLRPFERQGRPLDHYHLPPNEVRAIR
jgi:hypothetical protein